MRGYVLFQMREPFRQSLIKGHSFYVEQARKRLLSQFDNMEAEADQAAEEWLDQSGKYCDPDRHDHGDVHEKAYDVGIELYGLLDDMREQTRLSVVAGMFHEWDKQLRRWLVRQIDHWHQGDNVSLAVWSANSGQIADLLESCGWSLRGSDYFHSLEACRLVVNVFKHGDGRSLDHLSNKFPEYLTDPLKSFEPALWRTNHCDHRQLRVSDDQFQAFSDAILAFWRDVPEDVVESQVPYVPDWFGKAIQKDHAERTDARVRKQP